MNGFSADIVYTWETPIPFGKYKFHKLKDIPTKYLITLWENKCNNNKFLYDWLCQNVEYIKLRSQEPGSTVFVHEVVLPICTKITYPTEAEAKFKLKHIRKDQRDHKKPYRAYECPDCSGWHLTSKDDYKFTNKLKQNQ